MTALRNNPRIDSNFIKLDLIDWFRAKNIN